MLSLLAIVTVLFSGLWSALISVWLHRYFNVISIKRDVLRRFVGNRFRLTNTAVRSSRDHDGEPFVALNEVFVVYASDREVILAVSRMHEELAVEGRLLDNIMTLTKAMAKAARVPLKRLNDDFMLRPFTPPSKG